MQFVPPVRWHIRRFLPIGHGNISQADRKIVNKMTLGVDWQRALNIIDPRDGAAR